MRFFKKNKRIIGVLLFFFAFPVLVLGADLYDDDVTGTSCDTLGQGVSRDFVLFQEDAYPTLDDVLNWQIETLSLDLEAPVANGGDFSLEIEAWDGAASVVLAQSTNDVTYAAAERKIATFDFNASTLKTLFSQNSVTTPYDGTPASENYWVTFDLIFSPGGVSSDYNVYGHNPGSHGTIFWGRSSSCSSVFYPTATITGGNFDDINTLTDSQITDIITPEFLSTTASVDVDFEFEYWYGDDDFTDVGFFLKDLVINQEINTPLSHPIASGGNTYFETLTLTSGNYYSYQPFMRNPDTGETTVGDTFFFWVVDKAGTDQFQNSTTTLSSSSGFLSFLNVPQLLRTKAPFNYIYEFKTIVTDLDSYAGTSTPVFELPVEQIFASTSIAGSVEDVEFFSADTVTDLIPDPILVILRIMAIATVYVTVAFTIYQHATHRLV